MKKQYRERVYWLNEIKESKANHDFEIINADNSIDYYIECKGTSTLEKSFLLTKYEWELFLHQTKNYQVFFVYDALVELNQNR